MALETRKSRSNGLSQRHRCGMWFAALLVVVAMPFAMLGVAELGLRAAGYGHSTRPFVERMYQSQRVHIRNMDFFATFSPGLSAEAAACSNDLEITESKPLSAYRIFVFGGSAAHGWPDPGGAFSRVLKAMLRTRFPDTAFHLYNMAYLDMNSHAMRVLAKACERLEPDAFLVYMGNDEVTGPFGLLSDVPNGKAVPSLRAIRARILLSDSRLAAASSGGIPGGDTFCDYGHLNFHGSYIVAAAFFDQLVSALPDSVLGASNGAPLPPSEEECRRLLCLASRYEASQLMSVANADWRLDDRALAQAISEVQERTAQLPVETPEQRVACLDAALDVMAPDHPLQERLVRELMGQGDLHRASQEAQVFVEQFPCNRQSRWLLAKILSESGQADEAIAHLSVALALYPNDFETLTRCGDILDHAGRSEEAALYYARARASNPMDLRIELMKARSLEEMGETQRAAATYREIIARDPDFAECFERLDIIYESEADPAARVAQWRSFVLSRPQAFLGHFYLGRALEDTGALGDAMTSYRNASRITPGEIRSRKRLASILERSGRLENALLIYKNMALESTPCAEARVEEARLLERLGRDTEALDAYLAAVLVEEQAEEIYARLDSLIAQTQDSEGRIRLWKRLAAEGPESPVVQKRLGEAFEAAQDFTSAETAYAEAMRLASLRVEQEPPTVESPSPEEDISPAVVAAGQVQVSEERPKEDAAKTASSRGDALAQQGDLAGARAAFLEALGEDPKYGPAYEGLNALYPGDEGTASRLSLWRTVTAQYPKAARAHFFLGLSLEDCGEVGAAVAAYEKAHELAPEDTEIREWLVSALVAEGVYQSNAEQWGGGLARFKEALELDPARATAWCGIGAVKAHSGDLEAATKAYLQAIALDPNFVMPYHELDALCLSRDDAAGRVALWRGVVQDYPESARAHWAVGQALVAHGEEDEGVTHLRRACELAPDDAALKAEFGRTLFDLGRAEDAVEPLRRAAAMDESITYIHPILVAALCSTGAYDEAWTEVAKCRALGVAVPEGLIAKLQRKSGRSEPKETTP